MRTAIENILIGAMWVFAAFTFAKCIGVFEMSELSATPQHLVLNAVWSKCSCLPFHADQLRPNVWLVEAIPVGGGSESVFYVVCTEGETVPYKSGGTLAQEDVDQILAKHQEHLRSIGYEPPEPVGDEIHFDPGKGE